MSLEQIQQNYADATGFVMDRTTNPPKILGMAFLISKSRAVSCSSILYNYTEAPWALAIKFPHPDVVLGVRSVVIHPEFDKKAARGWYLNQTGNPGEQLVLMNDIGSLTVDTQLSDLQQDKVAELNRALSLPFSSTGVEASGAIRGDEFLSIINGLLQAHRSGLLTLMDSRNLPLARIQIAPGMIQKVYFRQLLGELAFFELVYRKPAEGYMFQTESTFNWGNVRDITAPPDALVEEALKRVNEMPAAFNYLGGAEARYQQRIENYDPNSASEQIRWFAERLWNGIDGYLTLDKMSERVGADTYTVLQAIREMVNKAQVSMINRSTPFHCNGALGQPLVSHTDFEVNAWDPLQAFYLDSLSARPVWQQGNFFGVANALQPKNMLHTIALPTGVPGSLILKDYKLIGIHSGPHTPRPGQPVPPVRVYQMMWMGALLDLSAKKMRADEQSATGEQSQFAGLRTRTLEAEEIKPSLAPERLEKYECPNCHATNTEVGPCFNCGTIIQPPEPEVEDPALQKRPAWQKKGKELQKKYGLTDQQLKLVAAAVGCFLLIGVWFFSTLSSAPPPSTTSSSSSSGDSQKPMSEKEMHLITDEAGFKGTAVPGYYFVDTSEQTKPNKSFGMQSDTSNQKVLFLIMDDMSAVSNLESFISLPPFQEGVFRAEKISDIKIDENFQLLGNGSLHWFLGRYMRQNAMGANEEDKKELILTGGYPSPLNGKSVLVIGRALVPGSNNYDYKSTLWLCDQMAADYTARGNRAHGVSDKNNIALNPLVKNKEEEVKDTTDQRPIATDKQLDDYAKKIETAIQAKLKYPEELTDEIKKMKDKKDVKAVMTVGINTSDGSINRLEFKEEPVVDGVGRVLEAAVKNCAPFEDPPRTKDGNMDVIVKLTVDKIKVVRPIL